MKTIMPYQTIGIIGGGQLARMMCLAAKAMGYYTAVLDPTPKCPAGQIADYEITAAYKDMEAIKKLAEISDIITYEFENIDYHALRWLEKNAYLPQGCEVLRITQNRYFEKKAIAEMGLRVAGFRLVENADALDSAVEEIRYPCVLKTTRFGYDGKGQIVLQSPADMPKAKELVEISECILEQFMPFSKEISVIIARSTTGETKTFPVTENIHADNILHQSIAPARISPQTAGEAVKCAEKISAGLNAIGVLAIEMFMVDEHIVINELAPRPHNSGHYTIDACITSQFEQHIRAVCGLPLADPSLHTPVVMVNILGGHINKENMSDLTPYIPLLSAGKLHIYGKAHAEDKRKMGHINILGEVEESLKHIDETGLWQLTGNL